MKCVLFKFVDNFETGHAIDMPENRAAVKRHLERLEKWDNKILMKSNYDSCKVLCLRHTHPLLPGISQGLTARKQFCWKDMVGSRPNMHHLCALAEKLIAYCAVAKKPVDQGKRLLPFIHQLRDSIRNISIVSQDLGERSVYKEDGKGSTRHGWGHLVCAAWRRGDRVETSS